jgi:hypothetical protein
MFRRSTMKLLRATLATLLLGTATLAVAQTRAESFADQFKTMQSLQSMGTYTFKPAPKVNSQPTNPVGGQPFADTFSEMQAASSNSGQWNSPVRQSASTYASESADPVGKESSSSMLSRMQTESSNSDQWKRPASEGPPANATAGTATVASQPDHQPTLRERMASVFRHSTAVPTPNN